MNKSKVVFEYKAGNNLPFGVNKVVDGVQFAVYLPDRDQCFLNLYYKGAKEPACRIELSRQYQRGSVYFVTITGVADSRSKRSIDQILSQDYEYMYETDGREFIDPYAAVVYGRERWGQSADILERPIRGGICVEEFDWQGDCPLGLSYHDMILYQLHVRGYTKHRSSKVTHKGTFSGLQEKIEYIKELGINGVMLLPCYEYNEILNQSATCFGRPQERVEPDVAAEPKRTAAEKDKLIKNRVIKEKFRTARDTSNKMDNPVKLNYWGYGSKENYYFAPKSSLAADHKNPVQEMKTLVRMFHQQGIEVLMDIYFSTGTNLCMMTDCLRHWVLEYHIDGFRVNQEVMPSLVMVSDPILSGVKLLTSYWDQDMLSQAGVLRQENALAEYNEGFMNDARRFLKSDEGQVENFVGRFRRNPKDYSTINFITHVNGFTMMDLVSYDIKHNEANGEMNHDGTEYNYSWNCGVEGRSRKKAIVTRRMCQIRNAFLMLLLSQGTPMILAGDEFGNSQQGNNNPYCQDNEITWLNWNQIETHQDIWRYVNNLIRFRQMHPVLHQNREIQMFDALSCGMPDLSVHGTQAWKPDYSHYNRMLGVLLYGDYQKRKDGTVDQSIYIIYNMYWEARSFDLPNLPDGQEWSVAVETYGDTFTEVPERVKKEKTRKKKTSLESQKKTVVPARSIVVFVGV